MTPNDPDKPQSTILLPSILVMMTFASLQTLLLLTAEMLCPGVAIGAVVVYVERVAIAVLSLILRSSLCDGCCYC